MPPISSAVASDGLSGVRFTDDPRSGHEAVGSCSAMPHVAALSEDGVDALVGDVFFVVECSDVGGDEGFDAVSESSGGFGEGHPCE